MNRDCCGPTVTPREFSQASIVLALLSIYNNFLAYCSLTISILKQLLWKVDAPSNGFFFTKMMYVLVKQVPSTVPTNHVLLSVRMNAKMSETIKSKNISSCLIPKF